MLVQICLFDKDIKGGQNSKENMKKTAILNISEWVCFTGTKYKRRHSFGSRTLRFSGMSNGIQLQWAYHICRVKLDNWRGKPCIKRPKNNTYVPNRL
jgi:hypothetical protein